MRIFSAREAKQQFGQVLSLAKETPVVIRKYNRRVAVVISAKAFDEFKALQRQALRTRFSALLDEIDVADPDRAALLARKASGLLRKAPR